MTNQGVLSNVELKIEKKTCNILITNCFFTSTLTNKAFHTRSRDDSSCKSTNVWYGLECNLCGLVYVGETQERLNKRMFSHRSGINTIKFPTVYQHFNQQDQSVLLMKIRVLEQIYHLTNSPVLSKNYRRGREEYGYTD